VASGADRLAIRRKTVAARTMAMMEP
jgi:hypothetical protein